MTAFLRYGNQNFFSRASNHEGAVTRLIEGIWDLYPQNAFRLLRSRIYTDTDPTLTDLGSVKLTAKRISVLNAVVFEEQLNACEKIEIAPIDRPREGVVVVPGFTGCNDAVIKWMKGFRFSKQDKAVVSVLLNEGGEPVLAAKNTASKNRLLHAEVNLIRAYLHEYKAKIPKHYQIWTSLKPCCMCACFIIESCEDVGTNKIVYLADDPGPKARNSPIIAGSDFWVRAGKPNIALCPY